MLTAILGDSSDPTLWMPQQASTYAASSDNVFYGVYYLSVFFFALVTLLLVAFIIKYRHRENGKAHESAAGHSTALELTWTIIPTILVLVIFYYGFRGFMNMVVEPPDAYKIDVRGKTWNWSYIYDLNYFSEDGKLHIPVNKPIAFILSSDDVIHSFFIPAFRAKKDVVPGRYNRFWVQANKTGTFDVTCAEYCGQGHSIMTSEVVVESPEDFAKFLVRTKNLYLSNPPLKVGEILYKTRGCSTCHTLDGTPNTGPTFKDMYGSQVPIKGIGNVLADENYIHESILDAQAKIVEGFDSPSKMPAFAGQFSERDINSIIAFLKSNSIHFKGDLSKEKTIQSATEPSTSQPTTKPKSPVGWAPPTNSSHSSQNPDQGKVIASSNTEVSQVWSSNHVR
jgi:cytochrome c oxidase subunit 2